MTDEMRVKAYFLEAYQHMAPTTFGYFAGCVYSNKGFPALFLGFTWQEAAKNPVVVNFWNKESRKIECPCYGLQGCRGNVGSSCFDNGDICPGRIMAAEGKWEREHAAERVKP